MRKPGKTRKDSTAQLERDFMGATALLYQQTEDGSLEMVGAATAFEKTDRVVRFISAAHCVAEDDIDQERVVVENVNWFITFDEPAHKNFILATLVAAGYRHAGDDFAVLEVDASTLSEFKVMPLAAHDPQLGEEVINVAVPLGLGKQLFRGHVTMEKLDRPLKDEEMNWKGAALLQINLGLGSSGSAVVSLVQKGIIAILVGVVQEEIGTPNVVALPISKFKKFWQKVKGRKYPYKWYNP